MIDSGTAIRKAYFNALKDVLLVNGNAIPVVDGKLEDMPTDGIFLVFGDQSEVDKSNKDKYVYEITLDVAVVDRRKATASKKAVEDVSNQILQLVLPTTRTIGISIDNPFTITFIKYISGLTANVAIDDANIFVQIKRLQFINRITQ